MSKKSDSELFSDPNKWRREPITAIYRDPRNPEMYILENGRTPYINCTMGIDDRGKFFIYPNEFVAMFSGHITKEESVELSREELVRLLKIQKQNST